VLGELLLGLGAPQNELVEIFDDLVGVLSAKARRPASLFRSSAVISKKARRLCSSASSRCSLSMKY
jgi:hypothetical protein